MTSHQSRGYRWSWGLAIVVFGAVLLMENWAYNIHPSQLPFIALIAVGLLLLLRENRFYRR